MRLTISKIDARIASLGYELLRGNGYFYFVPIHHDATPSLCNSMVLVSSLNQLTLDQWEQELKEKIEATKDDVRDDDAAPVLDDGTIKLRIG